MLEEGVGCTSETGKLEGVGCSSETGKLEARE